MIVVLFSCNTLCSQELSKITMPVVFNEPISFIQRLCEYMEYAPLIDSASKCDDPVERMEVWCKHILPFISFQLFIHTTFLSSSFFLLLQQSYTLLTTFLPYVISPLLSSILTIFLLSYFPSCYLFMYLSVFISILVLCGVV